MTTATFSRRWVRSTTSPFLNGGRWSLLRWLSLVLSCFPLLNQGGMLLFVPLATVSALQNLNKPPSGDATQKKTTFSPPPFALPFFEQFTMTSKKNAKNQKSLLSLLALEDDLLSLIANEGQRLSNSEEISQLIAKLEDQNPTPEPAIAPQIYGRWKLLFTTNTDTSSPIQRNAVNAQKFSIYQDIIVTDNDDSKSNNKVLQVNQVVEFSDTIRLSVDALASTTAYPLPELTERQGTGKILGLNILGVSLVGEEAQPDPMRPNSRIDFVFDQGYFDVFQINKNSNDDDDDDSKTVWFQVPYPVPFRWPVFRDAVKGWIDITYLSDRLRIARGNKGTTFVLQKQQ
ncbi:hypothetical protein ACA910_008735 [Epithemia clementina (nom. ined.)]